VITRHPDTGERDADTLREIRRYRGVATMHDGDSGIPFGVYARVVSPGRVAVDDAVRVGSG
jgi:MOSC domain-containing protein YiiM